MLGKPTAWAHLPNAKLIDAVIADMKTRPDVWRIAWGAARDAVRGAARDAAWDVAWCVAREPARLATRTAKQAAAQDAILALIAWDDCARLLDLPSDTLRTMADICDAPACHQAVLLLPYVLVKESK